jgi:hypothetical protein
MTERSIVIRASSVNAPTVTIKSDTLNRSKAEAYVRANVRVIADLEFKTELSVSELIWYCNFDDCVRDGSNRKSTISLGDDLITIHWLGDWEKDEVVLTGFEKKTQNDKLPSRRCSACPHLRKAIGFSLYDSCAIDHKLKFKSTVMARPQGCPLKGKPNEE